MANCVRPSTAMKRGRKGRKVLKKGYRYGSGCIVKAGTKARKSRKRRKSK